MGNHTRFSAQLSPGRSLRANSGEWYRVMQVLGEGTTGVTYLCMATSGPHKGIVFAAKVLKHLWREDRRKKFSRVTEFLKECCHPAIQRVYDNGVFAAPTPEDSGAVHEHPFLVAEYQAETLRDALHKRSLRMVEKTNYAVQLLSALTYLEQFDPQIIHRNINPQNVMAKGAECILGDFSMMTAIGNDLEEDRVFFRDSLAPAMATFYRTPDLIDYANEKAPLTTKSDVFQAGLVLAELFTGCNPMRPTRRSNQDDILGPVILETLPPATGQFGGWISTQLNRMLSTEMRVRPFASEIVEDWMGIFEKLSTGSRELEGYIF